MSQASAATGGLEPVDCALCGSRACRPSYTKLGLSIVECTGCGLRFVNPRYPKEVTWQRYSEEYFLNEYLPALGVVGGRVDLQENQARHAATLRLIEAEWGGTGRLLDIGSGAGLFLAAAAQLNWSVVGLELSPAGVEFSKRTLGLDVRQGTAESVDSLAETFDVVTMFDVIEHLYNPIAVLRLARSVLRPGGLIVVSTPNFDALSRLALGPDWAILSPLEHLYYFSAASLSRAFLAAGYASSRIHKRHGRWRRWETMNPRHTHNPNSIRARACFVLFLGMLPLYPLVQRAGLGDVLLGTARA